MVLLREAPLSRLLPGGRWEASGVIKHEGRFYVVFDDARVVGVLTEDLSTPGEIIDLPDGLGKGFEDLARDPVSGHTYLLVESVRRDEGGRHESAARGGGRREADKRWMARVEEYDAGWRRVADGWLRFPLPSGNKGIEGLTCVRRGDTTYLLGLCEGNWAACGKRGRTPGGGLIQVFARFDPDGCRDDQRFSGEDLGAQGDWSHVATVHLPNGIPFQDYSALAASNGRVAVVSQESAALWVGRFVPGDWSVDTPGNLYPLPCDEHGRIVYGNVEGVSWIGPDRLVMVSDRAKRDQPERCRGKQESIHVFELPKSDTPARLPGVDGGNG
jgi:hypothetical protein